MGTCTCLLATLVVIAAGLGLGLYFGYFTKQDLQDLTGAFSDGFTNILGADPFSGKSGGGINGTVYEWVGTNGNGGLTLELLNALDSSWQTFFEQAVSDWDSGTPDALTLTTVTSTPEYECEQVEGVMKVCNGDYGDTGWRGINELILTSQDKIVSSIAKMNEFYLTSTTSDIDKQYTMCHEIGHGFGLPHTDENFMNSPLGDCLDYSNSVTNNQKPGQVNYDKLVAAYGQVSSRRQRRERQISDVTKAAGRIASTPAWVKNTLREKVQAFQVGIENEGWTLLHQHQFGEIHSIEIGEGYRGHVNILLA
jgi:hypothetical protein